jgi:hypothetical protein
MYEGDIKRKFHKESSILGVGEGLTIPHRKTPACYEVLHRALELAGSCKHGNELSGAIKGGEFLD